METQPAKFMKSNVISDAAAQLWADALARLRAELVAAPAEQVVRPNENVARFVEQALAWVAARGGRDASATVARIHELAMALARAEREFIWERPGELLDDATSLLASADQCFAGIEEHVATRVRRGQLDRVLVPRRRGASRDDRCMHVLALCQVLRWHGSELSRRQICRAEKLAHRLYGAKEVGPDHVSLIEIRDRAYSALRSAMDAADSPPPKESSGVFALASIGIAAMA